MVGRPRKIGKRYPNGQPVREYVNPKKQVAMQPHRLEVMKKYREWPEAESEFGRLMLNGKITPAQYHAGRLYADLAAQSRKVYSTPPIHPTGMDLNRVSGGGHDGEMPKHIAEAIKRRHNDAYEACAEAGTRAARAVKDHAIMEEPVKGEFSLNLLIAGLDKLVSFFHVDRNLQISSHSINAR